MQLNVLKRFPTLVGTEEVLGALEAFSRATDTAAWQRILASHIPSLMFPWEKKE